MFDKNFFPCPQNVIEEMTRGLDLYGKVVYEPEAGKGDIVDFCIGSGASVIASEIHPDLRKIVASKCKVIAADCLTVTSDMISHVHFIIMNPPFNDAMKHIIHMYNIAPPGCIIRALCNSSNLENDYTKDRKQVSTLIDNYGSSYSLGNCFAHGERFTNVDITLIAIQKPGDNYEQEFSGFFLGEDEEEPQENAMMSYNVVRDLVNRYVEAIKIYDKQLETAVQLNDLTRAYFFPNKPDFAVSVTRNTVLINRNWFKKEMQKAGWNFIFDKMNLGKYATRGLRDDINKFVEQQQHIPFTMKNVYRMLEIVSGTTSQRMDKALIEVFDQITRHHDENRFQIEGWKTNSHYLVGRKFILPDMCYQDQRWYKGQSSIQVGYGGNWDTIEDLVKAMCYITGDKYESLGSLKSHIRNKYKIYTSDHVSYTDSYSELEEWKKKLYEAGTQHKIEMSEPVYGQWFEWAYFRVKCFKKGSMHFEFLDEDVWARFNQRIAKIKGFELFEGKKQTKYQQRQTGRKVAA